MKLLRLFAMILSLAGLHGCLSQDFSTEGFILDSNTNSIQADAERNLVHNFVVRSNQSWSAKIYPPTAYDWAGVSVENHLNLSGKLDETSVDLTLNRNTSGLDREAQIVFSCSTSDCVISVKQLKSVPFLSVTCCDKGGAYKDSLSINASKDTCFLRISTNAEWYVSVPKDPEALQPFVVNKSGFDSSEVEIDFPANEDADSDKSVTVNICVEGLEKYPVTFIQKKASLDV